MARKDNSLLEIEQFLEVKLDPFDSNNIRDFKRIFKCFKLDNNHYLLDSLRDDLKFKFQEFYEGFTGGGGTFDFGFNLENAYRIEIRGIFGVRTILLKSSIKKRIVYKLEEIISDNNDNKIRLEFDEIEFLLDILKGEQS